MRGALVQPLPQSLATVTTVMSPRATAVSGGASVGASSGSAAPARSQQQRPLARSMSAVMAAPGVMAAPVGVQQRVASPQGRLFSVGLASPAPPPVASPRLLAAARAPPTAAGRAVSYSKKGAAGAAVEANFQGPRVLLPPDQEAPWIPASRPLSPRADWSPSRAPSPAPPSPAPRQRSPPRFQHPAAQQASKGSGPPMRRSSSRSSSASYLHAGLAPSTGLVARVASPRACVPGIGHSSSMRSLVGAPAARPVTTVLTCQPPSPGKPPISPGAAKPPGPPACSAAMPQTPMAKPAVAWPLAKQLSTEHLMATLQAVQTVICEEAVTTAAPVMSDAVTTSPPVSFVSPEPAPAPQMFASEPRLSSTPKLATPELTPQSPRAPASLSAPGGGSECGNSESVDVLRSELTGLRAEVEALRGMLGGGAPAGQVAKLQQEKEAVESKLKETSAEASRLRSELTRCRGGDEEAAGPPKWPLEAECGDWESDRQPATLTTPPSSWEPPLQCEEAASVEVEAARYGQGCRPLTPRSDELLQARVHIATQAGLEATLHADDHLEPEDLADDLPSPQAQRAFAAGRIHTAAPAGLDVDEMWRAALQRFPQYPHWTLVKEKTGVYRMGTAEGRKIFCRLSRGGLQVRVGGGWMPAVPFLAKYGPIGMGLGPHGEELGNVMFGTSSSEHLHRMLEVPVELERLLVPTTSWAQRIGVCKAPDVREQQRHH